MINFLHRKLAFTLAEVLITLGIIGVVAALTIPTLITQYQKQQTVEQLKKVYSTLQQATLRSTVDNGPVSGWDFTLNDNDFMELYYVPYLKIGQNCIGNDADCHKNVDRYDLRGLSTTITNNARNSLSLALSDGTLIGYTNQFGWTSFIIDLNGNKGPNKVGTDFFALRIMSLSGKLCGYTNYGNPDCEISRGGVTTTGGTSGQCNTGAAGGIIGPGSQCSQTIINDGWQIKDDYPW